MDVARQEGKNEAFYELLRKREQDMKKHYQNHWTNYVRDFKSTPITWTSKTHDLTYWHVSDGT